MKFSNTMEEIKNKEENKEKIVLVRCGAFVIAIGNDAILLSKTYGLKLTCFKAQVCKVGIPVTHALKYLELIEKSGYSYVLYDYDKNTKKLIPKYSYKGAKNTEKENNINCKNCAYYIEHNLYNNIDIFEALNQKQDRNKENEQ